MPESDALPALKRLLADGAPTRVADGLDALSGLPGPRANLAVIWEFARTAPDALITALADDQREYVRMCAMTGLGRLWADGADVEPVLRAAAADPRWRVREAVAMALQLRGERDAAGWRAACVRWASAEPYVARAGVAGACEPRLLKDGTSADAALDTCATATRTLRAVAPEHRRDDAVRVLRQALGYGWSVAVAAAPSRGLALFAALGTEDPDVAWVVRENRKKSRLRRLLGP